MKRDSSSWISWLVHISKKEKHMLDWNNRQMHADLNMLGRISTIEKESGSLEWWPWTGKGITGSEGCQVNRKNKSSCLVNFRVCRARFIYLVDSSCAQPETISWSAGESLKWWSDSLEQSWPRRKAVEHQVHKYKTPLSVKMSWTDMMNLLMK